MALSNSHTFVALESVTAANLNGVITNILNNPISLVSPTTGAINFALQSHTNLPVTALTASSGSTGSLLTVSAAGTPIWATPFPRALQCIDVTSTGANINSTTATTLVSQAITPNSTTSRVKILFSCDQTSVAAAGIQQGTFTQIATSSGLIPNSVRGLTVNGSNALGVEACVAWTLVHQSTGPYPLTYAIQGFSASSTAASPYGAISNVTMILEELSS